MGFRRSSDRLSAARNWQQFVERNARLVVSAGLPPSATTTIRNWDDLLMRGCLPSDPGGFSVQQLTEEQYHWLVELTGNYFSAGYEFYQPSALRVEDQDALRARFG